LKAEYEIHREEDSRLARAPVVPEIFDPSKCAHPQWNDGMPESERQTCANCEGEP
jgi:hypothetical protein